MKTPFDRKRLAAAIGLGLCLGHNPLLAAQDSVPHASRDRGRARVSPVSRQIPEIEPARPSDFGGATPFVNVDPLPLTTEIPPDQLRKIDEELLTNIQQISDPDELVLALVRAGKYKIGLKRFDIARRAFDRAGQAVPRVNNPKKRDLRAIALVEGLAQLGLEQGNEALSNLGFSLLPDQESSATPERRLELLDEAFGALQESSRYVRLIEAPAYHFETIHGIVEAASRLGQDIGAAANAEEAGDQLRDLVEPLRERADRILAWATELTLRNPSPPWRDRGLAAISAAAAGSNQFPRSLEVARQIPTPEIRADALIRLADAEARRGSPQGATRAYSLAASAISQIPINDVRATLTNVLIDSLISAGRFPDARRAIILYPADRQRLEALSAVAKAMGERNLADQARAWINSEVPQAYRDRLLRKVSDGALRSLEGYRSETFLRGPRS